MPGLAREYWIPEPCAGIHWLAGHLYKRKINTRGFWLQAFKSNSGPFISWSYRATRNALLSNAIWAIWVTCTSLWHIVYMYWIWYIYQKDVGIYRHLFVAIRSQFPFSPYGENGNRLRILPRTPSFWKDPITAKIMFHGIGIARHSLAYHYQRVDSRCKPLSLVLGLVLKLDIALKTEPQTL